MTTEAVPSSRQRLLNTLGCFWGLDLPESLENASADQRGRTLTQGGWAFARTGLWVVLISIVLFWLRQPIWKAANDLPTLLDRADTISVGAWTIKMGEAYDETMPKDEKIALNGADSSEIGRLLSLGQNGLTNCSQPGIEANYYLEKTFDNFLKSRGMVETKDEPSLDKTPFSLCYSLRPTTLGHTTQDYLINFIYRFLSKSGKALIENPASN